MNFRITLLIASILVAAALCTEHDEPKQRERREPATGIASVLAPIAVNLIQGFLAHIFKPKEFQDTVLYGRSTRIKNCGENCFEMIDRATGITTVGKGSSPTEAVGDASKKLFDELIIRNLLTLHDLCELHMIFPHPNQEQCAGTVINPCDLIHPEVTTKPVCTDKLGVKYCQKKLNLCDDHIMKPFMHDNCLRSCTKGSCTFEEAGPVDPCQVKA